MQMKVTYLLGGKRQDNGTERLGGLKRTNEFEARGDDRGVCETVRDAVAQMVDRTKTCREVTNHDRVPMTLCIQDKQRSQEAGNQWRGRTQQVEPGDTYRVDPQREDIDAIIHSDGKATKLRGFGCWTKEVDEAHVQREWPECAGARGQTASPRNFWTPPSSSALYTFAQVDSANPGWQDGRSLASNKTYRIIPRPSDRWTLNRGVTLDDFTGSGVMDGHEIGIPKSDLRLAGVAALIWHHGDDGSAVPQIIDFSPGQYAAEFTTGANGGSIHFIIADRAGTYADNFGDCIVAITEL